MRLQNMLLWLGLISLTLMAYVVVGLVTVSRKYLNRRRV